MRISRDDGTELAIYARSRLLALQPQATVTPPRCRRIVLRRMRLATLALPFALAACATDGPSRGGLLGPGAPRLKVGESSSRPTP